MSKEDQVRQLREAKARKSNPFEDAARGRDVPPTSSSEGGRTRKQPLMASRPVPPGSLETPNPKGGRLLAKDAHKALSQTKPWVAEGMSRASWYRRQKGGKRD